MRRPPASVLGDASDGAAAPPVPQASGGAPPSLAGAKKSLGGTGSPSKSAGADVADQGGPAGADWSETKIQDLVLFKNFQRIL